MRKTFALVAVLALMVSTPVLATATNGVAVTNTGSDNGVTSVVSDTQITNVNQVNNTSVDQHVVASSNTGHNDQNGGISIGGTGSTTTTGSATVGVSNTTTAGQNTAVVTGNNGGGAAAATEVFNTGDQNGVTSVTSSTNLVNSNQVNNTSVRQGVHARADSGYNDQNGVIGGSTLNTGAAAIGVGLDVAAGSNSALVGGGTGLGAGTQNLVGVTNTGDHNGVVSQVTSLDFVNLNQVNNTSVSQWVLGSANSGHNDQNGGIGSSTTNTGSAGVLVGAEVNAGSNAAALGHSLPMGLSLSDFVNTGNNNGLTNVTTTTLLTNVNGVNNLRQHQWIFSNSSSGFNDANGVIGGGLLMTGGAGVGAGLGVSAGVNSALIGSGLLLPLGWGLGWWL